MNNNPKTLLQAVRWHLYQPTGTNWLRNLPERAREQIMDEGGWQTPGQDWEEEFLQNPDFQKLIEAGDALSVYAFGYFWRKCLENPRAAMTPERAKTLKSLIDSVAGNTISKEEIASCHNLLKSERLFLKEKLKEKQHATSVAIVAGLLERWVRDPDNYDNPREKAKELVNENKVISGTTELDLLNQAREKYRSKFSSYWEYLGAQAINTTLGALDRIAIPIGNIGFIPNDWEMGVTELGMILLGMKVSNLLFKELMIHQPCLFYPAMIGGGIAAANELRRQGEGTYKRKLIVLLVIAVIIEEAFFGNQLLTWYYQANPLPQPEPTPTPTPTLM
ncbi:MAG: hypothetical protein ACOC6Q_01865 [Patescibacteria group bacterium]